MSIKKRRKLRSQDPCLEREKGRYEHPIPSREYILQILTKLGVPTAENQLQEMLGIETHEQEAFARRLTAMSREGQIFRNRKGDFCVMEKLDLVKGTVQGHADGYGFLIPDNDSPDLFFAGQRDA